MPGRLFVLARHAQSSLNVERRINGDPAVDVPLTRAGLAEALLLGEQLGRLPLDVCVHTSFARTRRTAEVAAGRRGVPLVVEPLLDDVDVGDLEGSTIEEYRAWKQGRPRGEAFPGGESLDDAARRYAEALRALLARPEPTMLVVCHELPIRYAVNGAAGSETPDGPVHDIPNATPFLFDEAALAAAADAVARYSA